MSEQQQETVCFKEKDTVKQMLKDNNLVMSNLINQRIEIVK